MPNNEKNENRRFTEFVAEAGDGFEESAAKPSLHEKAREDSNKIDLNATESIKPYTQDFLSLDTLPLETLRTHNRNAHQSLTNEKNLDKISRIFEYSPKQKERNKTNKAHMQNHSLHFLDTNHTQKQTTPQPTQNTESKNAKLNNTDAIRSPYSTEIASTPAIYVRTENNTQQNHAQQKNTRQKNKKTKKQTTPKVKKKSFLSLGIFFGILCVVMVVGYKILANGIFIEKLAFGNIAIRNIFLQLNNKLILEIETLDLSTASANDNKEQSHFDETLQQMVNYTQHTLYVLSYFEKLSVKNMVMPNKKQWNLRYADSHYQIEGELFEANVAITPNQNELQLHIDTFQLKKVPLHIEGDLTYSIPKKELSFAMKMLKDSKESEHIALRGRTDFSRVSLQAHSTPLDDIEIIHPFINGIKKEQLRLTLQNWLFNNIDYDTLTLTNLSMDIDVNNIGESILHNTKGHIDIENPKVKLAKNIQPITAQKTLIVYDNANLKITPIHAEFVGMDLSDSEILIANMPHSDFILDLNGKNVRLDSNLSKILAHYGVVLPITQQSLKKTAKKVKKGTPKKDTNILVQQAIDNTESIVTNALKKNQTLPNNKNTLTPQIAQHTTTQDKENIQNAKIENENLYTKILELNPETTLTNALIHNPNASHKNHVEETTMHLQIAVRYNKKIPTKPLFSLQGIIQAQHTNIKLYDIPLSATTLNIALDITPNQKLVYINGERVKWRRLVDSDVNVLLDLHTQKLQANTYIHEAILNTANLKDITASNESMPKKSAPQTKQNTIDSKVSTHNGIYFETKPEYAMRNTLQYCNDCRIQAISTEALPQTNNPDSKKLIEEAKKSQLQNREVPEEIITNLPKKNIKDDGSYAEEDEHVMKDLRNNPVWNDLKIRTKKTKPFTKLGTKELTNLARKEIEREREFLSLEQDFLHIKKANIHLSLSFANNKVTLDVPALSLHLENGKELQLSIAKIENILQFSPLARYYGITHGNFSLATNKTGAKKDSTIDFHLNLTNLQHPLYTISHKRVTDLSLKGHIQDNALIIFINDDIDFKSQDSLSMLRIKGYRLDIDEAYKSKIPFFVDLLKDKQKDDLPYSEAAILQELKYITIKNKLRKEMGVKPTDFNIIGENLQLTFLGYTAPFDSVNMRFIDGRIMIDGQYQKGILNASLIKDNIYFKAKNFSGDFINIVLASVKDGKRMLNGGAFSVDGIYRGGILNATLEIQNTALIDFKSVQNIFALIDTVPSLFMFKEPHLSTKGYQVNYGKVLLALNNDYVGLQNIFLLGSSMDIKGQGIIDISSQEMNVNLNISTIKNLSKFINKIPVIGYLILGREGQISTNLIMSGKYTDPKVNITLAADIIKAPFNILRRVFPIEMLVNNAQEEEEMMFY